MEPLDDAGGSVRFGLNTGLLLLTLIAVLIIGGYGLYQWASPAYEEVRRETFEESRSYVHGTISTLRARKLEYTRADTKEERAAIRSAVLHETASFDRALLPDDLSEWIADLEEMP